MRTAIKRNDNIIEVKNLSFSYGTRGTALNNVSLKILPGQKVAFVGTSGSGKTTMTKLLMKFSKPLLHCSKVLQFPVYP